MIMHIHQALAAQTHRRMVDPITFAKRKGQYVTPRPTACAEKIDALKGGE
jgi:hypothetical protein